MLRQAGANLDAVTLYPWPTDRSWIRDFGPIFVRDARGRLMATDWRFNGWAKYDNWLVDDAIPEQAAAAMAVKRVEPVLGRRRIVLEGGSIDVNGGGSLLTTEECLLSPVQARNPGMTREQLESVFAKYLGVTNTLWLRDGIAGDDTHGHVDDIARFVDRSTVVAAVEPDRSEVNHEPLKENFALLKGMKDESGRPLRVVALPMPEPVYFGGQRLPASYANFYIANGLVLVPTFNDPNDRAALNALAKVFPERKVVGIHSGDLVLGLGTLHCLSQQQPATAGDNLN
jgi:agmatine deiminase